MRQASRTRAVGTILSSLVIALVGVPVSVSAHGIPPGAVPQARSTDLAAALGADGTFRGAAGVAGTVDTSAWALVSNLAVGEPPRFAPAGPSAVTSIGPWSALGSDGSGNGALGFYVFALAISGSDLYVGGSFINAAGIPEADDIAKWNGTTWSALGSSGAGVGALNGAVLALAVSGGDLYAGGAFSNAAGIPEADYVAKWSGTTWSALGGSGNGALGFTVHALAVSGADLYVGGAFGNGAGIAEADNIAKWDGSTWSALGSNGSGNGALNGQVNSLAVSGGDLFVGGAFSNAAGIPEADYVAKWSGTTWSALGGSGNGALGNAVRALAVSGANLYVGGQFSNAAGIATADYLAKWNGSTWSALGSNGSGNGALTYIVDALTISGSDLYVGTEFFNIAGIATADYLARWSGSAWSALGSNGAGQGALNGSVSAITVSGTSLYVGGTFYNAAGNATADYVAKWALVRKPDGRIRLGAGAYVGNNVYNTTGTSQTKTGFALRGRSITFGISVQNDGNVTEKLRLKATGAAASGYTVTYFHGTTNITAAVVAGTFTTTALAPGAVYLITAKVTVKSTALVGSRVTRLVTATSVGDGTRKDAVKFIGKRS